MIFIAKLQIAIVIGKRYFFFQDHVCFSRKFIRKIEKMETRKLQKSQLNQFGNICVKVIYHQCLGICNVFSCYYGDVKKTKKIPWNFFSMYSYFGCEIDSIQYSLSTWHLITIIFISQMEISILKIFKCEAANLILSGRQP